MATPDQTPPLRIAFVEDSLDDFRLMSRVFRSHGALTHWLSAEAALAAIDGGAVALGDIDLLLVDLHLPGIDGIALVQAARGREGGGRPTICMLTSSESPQDVERASRAGADGYVVKPSDVSGLRALPGRLAAIAAAR